MLFYLFVVSGHIAEGCLLFKVLILMLIKELLRHKRPPHANSENRSAFRFVSGFCANILEGKLGNLVA